MRWDLTMIFDDAALPLIDERDGCWTGTTTDCTGDTFDILADYAQDAVAALISQSMHDVTFKLIASERFPDQTWVNYDFVTSASAWSKAFDARLPGLEGLSATAIRSMLASGPTASADLEEKWIEAVIAELTSTKNVNLAIRLLAEVKSLRDDRVLGTQCFLDYEDNPGIYDCRLFVTNSTVRQPEAKLVLVQVEIRDGG